MTRDDELRDIWPDLEPYEPGEDVFPEHPVNLPAGHTLDSVQQSYALYRRFPGPMAELQRKAETVAGELADMTDAELDALCADRDQADALRAYASGKPDGCSEIAFWAIAALALGCALATGWLPA